MRVLDAPPAPPPRQIRLPRTGWAAGVLAAAGILVVVGALNPLSHVVLTGPDFGSGVVLRPARVYDSAFTFLGAINTSSGRDPLIVLGCVAIVLALVMGQRRMRMRWVRPLAVLTGGLMIGALAMVAVNLFQSQVMGLGGLQLVTVFDAGTWLSLAGLVVTIAAIVLALRLPDDQPVPEPDLDTPPLGLPVIHTGQRPDSGLDHNGDTTLN